jgi:trehalose-6-phosphatase
MAAVLPASTKALLKDLSSLFVTGVVSGRSLDKLQHFVGLENDVFFAGSHGFDITGPGPPPCGPAGPETDELNSGSGDVKYPEESNNSRPSSPSSPSSLGLLRGASSPPGSPISMRHQVAVEFLPRLQLVKQELEAKLADVAGASVEDNRFSLSVHYRNVETDSGRQVIGLLRARE